MLAGSAAGHALCQAGRWEEAVPLLQRLDVLQPESPRTLFYLGAALANSGRLDEARVRLEEARLLAPNAPEILEALGDVESRTAASVPTYKGEDGE